MALGPLDAACWAAVSEARNRLSEPLNADFSPPRRLPDGYISEGIELSTGP